MKKLRFLLFGTNPQSLFLRDLIWVLVSISGSILVRAQFRFFLVEYATLTVLIPVVIALRLFFLFFLDHYRFGFSVFTISDVSALFRHNLGPTIVLLLLRLFSPLPVFRMPLSIILTEYLLTTSGMIIIRMRLHERATKALNHIGHRPRVLLWAEPSDIKKTIGSLSDFSEYAHIDIVGIITPNPLYWESRYDTVRVYGNHETLEPLVQDDDRISMVLFVAPERLTWHTLRYFSERLDRLRLKAAIVKNDELKSVSFSEVAAVAGYGDVFSRK